MKKLLLVFCVVISIVSCTTEKKVPNDLIKKIADSYKEEKMQGDSLSFAPTKIFKRNPKLAEVKEPTSQDSITLPSWIINKKYVSENADAIKYNPALLLGALAKKYNDGTFEIYTVTYNVRIKNEIPVLTKIEKPINFFEQTFNQNTRFNSNFIIGGLSVGLDETVKITYTETNYGNLEKYDEEKIEELRKTIVNTEGANKQDWAIIRGVVLLDCTSSKFQKSEISANIKASWITADGGFYKQLGTTDNFRLLSIDLENLFLLK
jgi:hypothetical protein